MSRHCSVWCASVAILVLALGAAASRADTFIYLDSQPGDYIGGGIQRTLRPGTLHAQRGANQTLELHFAQGTVSFDMTFQAAGGAALAIGEYDHAVRYPFNPPSSPGLDVSGNGAGCNTISGEFVIRELSIDPSGNVTKLALDFEQYCDSYSSALFGVVRIGSDLGIVDGDGDGKMDIADNCPLVANPTQLDTDGDEIGDVCDPEIGLTAVFLDSQSGDFIGRGIQQTFTVADSIRASRISGGVEVYVAGAGSWWLDFSAPSFGVGVFEGAERNAFRSPGRPGLDVSGGGWGCNTLTGRYRVLEAVFADDGSVEHLAIDFEQHCQGAAPALFGSVRINSLSAPLPTADRDGDHRLDVFDNCPGQANPDQADRDGDRIGDACDQYPDQADDLGACLVDRDAGTSPLARQLQSQLDTVLSDSDGDGVLDLADHCSGTPAGASVDLNGCTGAQACAAVVIETKQSKKLCLLIHSDDGQKLCKVAKGPAKTKLCSAR